jgi:hypothetical protein
MKACYFVCAVVLAGFRPCPAQHVKVVPDIAIAEAEYLDANEAWVRNDPNLEGELFKGDPEQMRRRIHTAAGLRDDAMAKKQTYLSAMIGRLEDLRGRLIQPATGRIPVDTMRKNLEAEQVRTLDEQRRVEGLLADLPVGDEYLLVRRALDEERSSLIKLQNEVALRIRSLDSLDKAQQAIQNASGPDALVEQMNGIIKLWDQERAATNRQRALWAKLYVTMEQSLDKKSPGPQRRAAAPRGSEKELRRQVAAGGASTTAAGPTAFAGTWIYRSQPGAWSGYGEPETATLEIQEESGALRGTYIARLPVRTGLHEIRLVLTGERQPGNALRLRWKSVAPAAEGEMDLKLGADGRLLVERVRSSDAYIPRGMEVLLRR